MHILLLLNIIYFIIILFKIFMNKKFNLLYRFLIFFYRTFQVRFSFRFAKLSGPDGLHPLEAKRRIPHDKTG